MLRDITFAVIGLCIIVSNIVYPYKLYNNYCVFRLWPSPDKVDFLMSFQNSFDFWSTYSIANEYADVMISPNEHDEFIRVMKESKITVKTLIDNVELQILRSKPTVNKISTFDFETYHPLANINAYLRKLQEAHPKNVMILESGKTYENRIIEGVKINMRPRRRVPLKKAVIEGGIHAREWISPAVVVFIIYQLITSADPQIKFMASSYEWHIFPVLNPDGYEYSHVKDRLWKKNRSKRYICDEEPAGVDLDRNFDFRWMDVDASNNPCSENFAGLKAFSEVETENYSTYLKSLNQISVYVSFHSYAQMVLIPYGHTASEMDNYNEQMGMASKVADKIQSKYSINYNINTAGNLHKILFLTM